MTTSQHPDGYDYAEEQALLAALDDAQAALRGADVGFLVMGGVASGVFGRPRWTQDVDLFVRLEDAGRALEALDEAGFETWVQHQHWLAKAKKHGIVVDVISRSHNDILLDDEMLRRARTVPFKDRMVTLVPAEDLVVMKAVATSEDTPRYWYDAIGIIAHSELDWEYLLRRARPAGVRRVLSLLLYAQSVDVLVPSWAVAALAELVTGSEPPSREMEAVP
jgi:predicted nucleotidyltransferase